MSFGKKIVISNVDWSALDINKNISYRLDSPGQMMFGNKKTLYVWWTYESESIEVTSSDSSVLSIGSPSGLGTEDDPFVYELTMIGLATGTVTVTIAANSGSKSFQQLVSEVPSGYTKFAAIHLDSTADATVYCDIDDIQLSQNYSYELHIKRDDSGYENSACLFGLRGGINRSGKENSTLKSFAIFASNSAQTAEAGYWWNASDTIQTWNGIANDGNIYTITVTPAEMPSDATYRPATKATFVSSHNDATVEVEPSFATASWVKGFSFFNYRYGNGNHGATSARGTSIGTTIVRDSSNNILYKFIPVKSPENKYGYYESVTKKFYGFNENTEHYDSISGETE